MNYRRWLVARSVLRVPLSALAMAADQSRIRPRNGLFARVPIPYLEEGITVLIVEASGEKRRRRRKKPAFTGLPFLPPEWIFSLSLLDWFRSWIGDVRDVCTTSNSLLHLRLVRISRGINFASPRETAPMRKWVLCMASSLDWNRVCIGRGPISKKDEAVLILWRQMTR